MNSLLQIEVTGHEVSGPGLTADAHVFCLRLWVDGNATYEIRRSYSAFLSLDGALRKRFPRSELPTLPLEAARLRARDRVALTFSTMRGGLTGKGLPPPRSAEGDPKAKARLTATDAECLASKQRLGALESYLLELVNSAEVVSSAELQDFLRDDGSLGTDGLDLTGQSAALDDGGFCERVVLETASAPKPPSEIDFCLEGIAVQRATIRRGGHHSQTLCVPVGHYVGWSFASAPGDIAFSVSCNGIEVSRAGGTRDARAALVMASSARTHCDRRSESTRGTARMRLSLRECGSRSPRTSTARAQCQCPKTSSAMRVPSSD